MESLIETLIRKITQWGDDRNLTAPENLTAQTLKLVSEFGEIAQGHLREDQDEIKDGVGDTMVVGLILAKQLDLKITGSMFVNRDDFACSLYSPLATIGLFADAVLKKQTDFARNLLLDFIGQIAGYTIYDGYDLEECMGAAYNEIKDRKGVMYNGAFIKEADPQYAVAMAELGRAG